jgi:hypothetical protein
LASFLENFTRAASNGILGMTILGRAASVGGTRWRRARSN